MVSSSVIKAFAHKRDSYKNPKVLRCECFQLRQNVASPHALGLRGGTSRHRLRATASSLKTTALFCFRPITWWEERVLCEYVRLFNVRVEWWILMGVVLLIGWFIAEKVLAMSSNGMKCVKYIRLGYLPLVCTIDFYCKTSNKSYCLIIYHYLPEEKQDFPKILQCVLNQSSNNR